MCDCVCLCGAIVFVCSDLCVFAGVWLCVRVGLCVLVCDC